MRLLRYVLWNVALGGLLVLGPVQGGEIISNVALGVFWFIAIVTPTAILLTCMGEAMDWNGEKRPPLLRDVLPVDQGVDIGIDIGFGLVMLTYGWIVIGVIWLLHVAANHLLITVQASMRAGRAEKEEPTWTRV